MSRNIGILTSGGDCAGLNAAIRAITARAIHGYGWSVTGIHKGVHGLMARPVDAVRLDLKAAGSQMLRLGGTILGTTNKGDPFLFPGPGGPSDRSAEVVEGFRMLGLDGLIGIGGDGSLRILRKLAQQGGIPLVGIPKTIDNDLGLTERSIGYDTAVAVAAEALDRLQPTAASHDRVMILEVMGRDAGHIALAAGIAGGADVILIPEIPYSLAHVEAQIRRIREQEKRNFALVIVAEAVRTEAGEAYMVTDPSGNRRYSGIGAYLAHCLERQGGAEVRVTVLGHVQRGSQPSAPDRLLASALGVAAVDALAQGRSDRMIAWWNRDVIDVPLAEAIADENAVDVNGSLVKTARGLGICLGDR